MGFSPNNDAYPNVTHANTEATMVDMTREDAEQLAISEIKHRNKRGNDDLVVDKSQTTEYPFGWVVIILPKKYIESRENDLGIFGLGFYIVTRDGQIAHVPSSISPDLAIDWFTKNWKPAPGHDQAK
jgi:hypothetical protein